ncbi:MAG: hypothetical protein HYR97_05460 [Candidatus Melainabacteria bacterium]|nr:hypothetical protein [Candidatus Melainabacteria bacterium]
MPAIWYQIAGIGIEQIIIFGFTVFVTLTTDLLWGIFAGIVLELLITTGITFILERRRSQLNNGNRKSLHNPLSILFRLFQNPVSKRELVKNEYHLYFDKPLVTFNALHLNKEIANIPKDVRCSHFYFTKGVTLIDHTTCENIFNLIEQNNLEGRIPINIDGMQCMRSCSSYPSSMRLVNLELDEAREMV